MAEFNNQTPEFKLLCSNENGIFPADGFFCYHDIQEKVETHIHSDLYTTLHYSYSANIVLVNPSESRILKVFANDREIRNYSTAFNFSEILDKF